MAGSQFDAWTRRRFGLAARGLAASLMGLGGLTATEAKNNNDKNKNDKVKKCKKLGTGCNPDGKKQCCDGICEDILSVGGHRCCYEFPGPSSPCSSDSQCCGNLRCVGPQNARLCTAPLL